LFFSVVDASMQLFGVMAAILIGVGALVGGIIGNLLPKITTGVSLGFFLASFVASVSCLALSIFQSHY
jgi:uncharacterized membrane protein YeaQ/YmgE (transglycosylase-associated protein family)